MCFFIRSFVWASLFAATALCSATCLPIAEAQNHIGETRCVTGKVLKVGQGDKGVHFLDFCENHDICPFTVVVFASDLRYIGDITQLAGKTVEIHGPVKLYDNRAEIILNDQRQLKGEGTKIPPLPKTYDVEKKGRYSPGIFSHAKAARQPSRKRQTKPIPQNDPSETDSSVY
ncbi:MAG TPA: hypothetical protein VFQ43_09880 [Nitrososphaera sp.]|nr:hypothetical protein [Nitrososphaera sp.]